MPRSISSLKRTRQNAKRAGLNKGRKTSVKTIARTFEDALKTKDAKKIEDAFREITKELDRNATRKTIHPNAVARRKSRMARRINQLKAQGAS